MSENERNGKKVSGSGNSEMQSSDTTGDIESLQKLNEEISNTLFEDPRLDLVFAKRTEFVLRTPDENNSIRELINLPLKDGANGGNEITQDQIHVGLEPTGQNAISTQKTTPYPSYLDQIKFFHELPVRSQHAIRAMELAKKYKIDIIDMIDEIDEPVIWIRKVMVAATALALMHGNKLDDARRVQALFGIDIDIARCIQKALTFKTMLHPIFPEMERWFKDNLTPSDFEVIAAIAGADKCDLPYLLKGQTPPSKWNIYNEFPDFHKDQLQECITVFREIRNCVKSRIFNQDSARHLLIHLNKNITAINEIFEILREKGLF
jgi:hypothetical protein